MKHTINVYRVLEASGSACFPPAAASEGRENGGLPAEGLLTCCFLRRATSDCSTYRKGKPITRSAYFLRGKGTVLKSQAICAFYIKYFAVVLICTCSLSAFGRSSESSTKSLLLRSNEIVSISVSSMFAYSARIYGNRPALISSGCNAIKNSF